MASLVTLLQEGTVLLSYKRKIEMYESDLTKSMLIGTWISEVAIFRDLS
jgi:hypothetical protein